MSSINIDLSVLKEEVRSYLRDGSKFINSSISKMRSINLPNDASFKSELNEIDNLLDTIKKNVTDSINTIDDRIQIFNQVEKTNKRFFAKLDDKYRVKEVEIEQSTAEEKIEQIEQTESEVEDKPEIIETKTASEKEVIEVQKAPEVKKEVEIAQTAAVVATEVVATEVAAPILATDNVEKETQAEKSESFISKVGNWLGEKWDELTAWLTQKWKDFRAKWNNDQERVLLPDWEMSDKTSDQVTAEINTLESEITDLVAQRQELTEKLSTLIANNGSIEEITTLQNQIENIDQTIETKIAQLSDLCVAQNLKTITDNIEKLDAEIDDLEKQRSYIKFQINSLNSTTMDYSAMAGQAIGSVITGTQTNNQKIADLHVQLAAIEKQIEEKNAEKITLLAEKTSIERQLNEEFYLEFTKNEDFEKYSDIVDKSDLVLSDEYIECTGYLSEYEEKMYAYLQRTKGTAASEEYLNTLRSVVNYRKGYDNAVEFLKEYVKVDEHGNIVLDENGNPVYDNSNDFVEAVKAINKGFFDGTGNFVAGIENYFMGITGEMDVILSAEQYEQMIIIQNLQSGDKTAYEISSSIGNMAIPMVTSAALNYFLPGSGSIVASTMMGVSSAGNAWKQAYSETVTRQVKRDENGNIVTNENGEYEYVYSYTNGTSFKQAALIGHATGTSEAVLGYALGKIPGISKMDNVKVNSLATLLKSVAGNAASEGLEEGVQYLVGQCVEAAVTGKPVELSLEEGLKNVAYGVATAGILNGGQAVVNIGQNVYTLNIDYSRVSEPGYIQSITEALNYKFNGTVEAYENLSGEAQTIVDGLIDENVTDQYIQPDTDPIEVEYQEVDTNINVKEIPSTTSANPSSTNSSQIANDNQNMTDVYSYSDQRGNVGAEFHENQSDISADSAKIDLDSPINFDSLASSIKTKLDEIKAEANNQLDSLEKSIEGITDIYSDSNSAAAKFSQAADLSQQIIDKKADTLIGEIEAGFDNLINQDVVKKKDDISIHFDALANAVDGTAEDIKLKIQNDQSLQDIEYEDYVQNYLNDQAMEQAYEDVDVLLDDTAQTSTSSLEIDLENIRSNAQKDMDSFLEEIGLKEASTDTSIPTEKAPVYEDIFSYSDQRLNTGQDFADLQNETSNLNIATPGVLAGAAAVASNIANDRFGIFNEVEYVQNNSNKNTAFSKLKSIFNKNNQNIQKEMSDQYYYLNNSQRVMEFVSGLKGSEASEAQRQINYTDFDGGSIAIETGKCLENLVYNDDLLIGIHRAGDGSNNYVINNILTSGLVITGHTSSGVGQINGFKVDENISFPTGKEKFFHLKYITSQLKSAHIYKANGSSNVAIFAFPKDAIKDNGYADLTKYPDLIITNQSGKSVVNPKYTIGYVHNNDGNVGKINFNSKFFGFESEGNQDVVLEKVPKKKYNASKTFKPSIFDSIENTNGAVETLYEVKDPENLNNEVDLKDFVTELMMERYNQLLQKSKSDLQMNIDDKYEMLRLNSELSGEKSLTELLNQYNNSLGGLYSPLGLEVQIRELISQNPNFQYVLNVDNITDIDSDIFQFFDNNQISFEVDGRKMTVDELYSEILNDESIPKHDTLRNVLFHRTSENMLEEYRNSTDKKVYLLNLRLPNVISLFKTATDSEIFDIIDNLKGTILETSVIGGLTFEQFNNYAKNEDAQRKARMYFGKLSDDNIKMKYLSNLDADIVNEWFDVSLKLPNMSVDFVNVYNKLNLENKNKLIGKALNSYESHNETERVKASQIITLIKSHIPLSIINNENLLTLTEMFPELVINKASELTKSQVKELNETIEKKLKIGLKEKYNADFITLDSDDLKVKATFSFINGEMKDAFERVLGSKHSSRWSGDLLERMHFQSSKIFNQDSDNQGCVGYNNIGGTFINAGKKYLEGTISHETLHDISRGKSGVSGLYTDKKFKGVNECVTEYFNKLLFEENYSKLDKAKLTYSGYDLGTQKVKLLVKYGIIDHFELADAYMSNDSEYLRSICESDEEFAYLMENFNKVASGKLSGALELDKFIIKKRLEQRRNR